MKFYLDLLLIRKMGNLKNISIVLLIFTSVVSFAQNIPEFKSAIKLSNNVNSQSDELKPIFDPEGTEMYFTRAKHKENAGYSKRHQDQDIWKSTKNGDDWNAASNQSDINDEWDNSLIGKGKWSNYYLLNTYQSDKDLDYGIARTQKTGENSWSKPEQIKVPKLKYDGSFYDFYISHDEEVLIISIKGENSLGEEDLYVSNNTEEGWSEPKSLGKSINTSGFEMSPFLSDDKKYLFFSSNGRKDGLGNADVYVSERLDDTWSNWSIPENLGEGVNSTAMDCYFTVSNDGGYYFSSNRDSDNLDIYKASEEEPPPVYSNIFMVQGFVKDSSSTEPVSTELVVKDSSGAVIIKTKSAKDGSYKVELKKSQVYTFNILEPKYHEHHGEIKTPALESSSTSLTNNIWLKPYKKGDEIKLEALYFVVNTDSLRDISLPTVDKLAQILTENPDIKISIEGHTSSDGLKHLNLDLSERRAKKIKTILTEKDIKKNRLKTVGFGQAKPKVKNDSEEHRKMNRRVEFIILD